MEKEINIVEILKDCPSGMELNCTMFENVTFEGIKQDEYPIIVKIKEPSMYLSLTKTGCWNTYNSAKCVIFPKGKTTWEGFTPPCKFKDGDIIFTQTRVNWISIYKEFNNNYLDYCTDSDTLYTIPNSLCRKNAIKTQRLATEEEKQKLFDAIKKRGYKWNEETKTLEKLPKFKVGDRIKNKNDKWLATRTIQSYVVGIGYFTTINDWVRIEDQNDWELVSDKVEPLFKVGDEIVKKNGITNSFIVQSVSDEYYGLQLPDKSGVGVLPTKDQDDWMVISSKPKFKVGDKIRHKETVLSIVNVGENKYVVEDTPKNYGLLTFSTQDVWELVVEPKFKVGDEVYNKKTDMVGTISKIYDDENEYMVNLKKGGITFICFEHENCWDLVSDKVEPKFKAGDIIRKKGDYIAGTVVEIDKEYYYKVEYNEGGVSYVNIKSQNDWEQCNPLQRQ